MAFRETIRCAAWVLAVAFLCRDLAAMEWEEKRVELNAEAGQMSAVAIFSFRNDRPEVVQIVSVQSSCDCLSVMTSQEKIGLGQRGEIRVRLDLKGLAGRQEKTVSVTTDEAGAKPTVLTLVVNLPEPVKIAPRFVYWRIGEAVSDKEIELSFSKDSGGVLEELACADSSFAVRGEPTTDPLRFRLVLRPASTERLVQTPVRVVVKMKDRRNVFVVYAAVINSPIK